MSLTRRVFVKSASYATALWPTVVRAFTPEAKKIQQEERRIYGPTPELRKLQLVMDHPAWPEAAHPSMICSDTDETEQAMRAEGIIEFLIDEDLEGKTFLDYGCGRGHTIEAAMKKGASRARGYDPFTAGAPYARPCVLNSIDGRYNVILMNDVLDHLKVTPMVKALREAKEHLAWNGRIYVRCHPFTSRTGGHLYKQLNKAYAHLVFSSDELQDMGYKPEHVEFLFDPMKYYQDAIQNAGLKIISEHQILDNVERFFLDRGPVRDRFLRHWNGDEKMAIGVACIQFVDYVLAHA